MTTVDDTERRIAAWFGDETARAPERTIDSALAHARSHPRRRDPFAALRRDPMSRGLAGGGLFAPVPLLAVLGLVLAAAVAGAAVGGFFDRGEAVAPPPPSPTVGPTPPAPPSPSPSPAQFHVDLIEQEGADASIDITDRSATVESADSGRPAPGGSVADGVDVRADPSDDLVIVLTWTGTPCDTAHTLEIEADGRTMTLGRLPCAGDAFPRDLQLRLRYAEPIDPGTITATLSATP